MWGKCSHAAIKEMWKVFTLCHKRKVGRVFRLFHKRKVRKVFSLFHKRNVERESSDSDMKEK